MKKHTSIACMLILFIGCAFTTTAFGQFTRAKFEKIPEEHPRTGGLTSVRLTTLVNEAVKEPLNTFYSPLVPEAFRLLKEPVLTDPVSQADEFQWRVYVLTLVHIVAGGDNLKERLWKELDNAANLTNWKAGSFDNAGKLLQAFTVAYDWRNDQWTDEQKAILRTAMKRKAMQPGRNMLLNGNKWFAGADKSRTILACSVLAEASYALAKDDEELSLEILKLVYERGAQAMDDFVPSGASPMGPERWNKILPYAVRFVQTAEYNLGQETVAELGLETDGFKKTEDYPIAVSGPSGYVANHGDSNSQPLSSGAMFWLAARYQNPVLHQYALKCADEDPLSVVWYQSLKEKVSGEMLKFYCFPKGPGAFCSLNSSGAVSATFAVLKGGDATSQMAHADAGSIILDWNGERWFHDLGPDSSGLDSYFGDKRFQYQRTGRQGHSCLLFNPSDSPGIALDQTAEFVVSAKPTKDKDGYYTSLGLTEVFADYVSNYTRSLAVYDDGRAIVLDVLKLKDKGTEVWWIAYTDASATVKDNEVTLIKDSKRAKLRFEVYDLNQSPKAALTDFEVTLTDASPIDGSANPQGQNQNFTFERINLKLENASVRGVNVEIRALFTPLE